MGAWEDSLVNVRCEPLYVSDCIVNRSANFWSRGKFGIAQPVMTHHAALIGIGDGTFLQSVHGCESLSHWSRHGVEVGVGEIHPAQVNGEADGGKRRVVLLESFP